ncbi:MAG: hypothetical protein BGO29_05250 [Bacteroidales bacterium 36-12]|nr:MAG: hypothetical protein BGO29_05250 [Bacteroidales bacterium 36-12]
MISITFLVAVFNVFLAIIMFINNRKLNKNVIFFSLFLLIISFTSVLYDHVINGGSVRLLLLMMSVAGPLFFLCGPLFYFFIRGVVDEEYEFSDRDLIHLLPFLINMIILLPYLFKPYEFKYTLAENSLGNLPYYMNTVLVFSPTWMNTQIRTFAILIYIIWSLIIIRRSYNKKISSLKGVFRKKYISNYRWLNTITFSLFVLSSLHFALTMYFRFDTSREFMLDRQDYIFVIATIFNSLAPLIILFNPGVLFGFPTNRMLNPLMKDQLNKTRVDASYSVKEAVDEAHTYNVYFDELSKILMQYITEKKPYLEHGYNAEKLSADTEIPLHHIHFCVKYCFGSTCKKMMAELRMKHIKEKIIFLGEKNLETIKNIVYDSGFDSYKSFLKAFKQKDNMTFDQWLEENT